MQISLDLPVLVGEPSGGAHDSAKTGVGCVALDRRQPAFRRAPACLRAALPPLVFFAALRTALSSPVKNKKATDPDKIPEVSRLPKPHQKDSGLGQPHFENRIYIFMTAVVYSLPQGASAGVRV